MGEHHANLPSLLSLLSHLFRGWSSLEIRVVGIDKPCPKDFRNELTCGRDQSLCLARGYCPGFVR